LDILRLIFRRLLREIKALLRYIQSLLSYPRLFLIGVPLKRRKAGRAQGHDDCNYIQALSDWMWPLIHLFRLRRTWQYKPFVWHLNKMITGFEGLLF